MRGECHPPEPAIRTTARRAAEPVSEFDAAAAFSRLLSRTRAEDDGGGGVCGRVRELCTIPPRIHANLWQRPAGKFTSPGGSGSLIATAIRPSAKQAETEAMALGYAHSFYAQITKLKVASLPVRKQSGKILIPVASSILDELSKALHNLAEELVGSSNSDSACGAVSAVRDRTRQTEITKPDSVKSRALKWWR